MKKEQELIEPGLLPVFRLLIGIRLVLLWLTLCLWVIAPDERGQRFPLLGVVETIFLLIFLLLNWPRRALGRVYLPVAIGIATLGPVAEYVANVLVRLASHGSTDFGGEIVFLILLLLIPLIIVSWQYNFRAVVAFNIGTALLEIAVGYPLDRLGGPKLSDVAGAIVLRSVLFVLIGFMVVRIMAAQRVQRKALAEANSQLTRYAVALEQLVTSRERNRMARELHDTLAHTLSALAVQLEAINALWDTDPAKARNLLGESLGSTRSGLAEARRAIQALRSTPLEDVGLALAVRDLAESVAARSALKLTLDIPEQITHLDPDAEQAIYRIADEAITNVARHAQAQRLSVMLRRSGGSGVRLEIADDGRGFDPAHSPDNGHYGLRGIQERAELIGAQVQVESRPGQGTIFRLTMGGTA